jgi:glucose-1-phosphate thymidylyltransferase
MLAGIREILFISTPTDLPRFRELFGTGEQLGLHLSYAVQDKPRGLADAFRVGADFIGSDRVCLVLGDNIFYGHGLADLLREAAGRESGATVFGYYVNDPERYGVIEFNRHMKVISIEEKPAKPKSNYAAIGLYFYDNDVVRLAKDLAPSARGEIEITDLNRKYLEMGKLNCQLMGRGFAWLDTGTHASLVDATLFIKTIEDRQGMKISCIEEIAFQMGYIDATQLRKLAGPLCKSGYGEYLLRVLEQSARS